MHFDNRVSVEERYPDRFCPELTQDDIEFAKGTDFSIAVFGLLVVLSGVIGIAMIVIGTIEHVSR